MNKNILNVFKNLKSGIKLHSPEILAGIGIAGFLTTTYLAVKATPEAINLIEEKKKEENTDKLTTVETIKTAWIPYVPAAITGVASSLCVVGSVSTSLRRNAALATAYEMSKTFAQEYKQKVIETIGEKREAKIEDSINQQRIDNNVPVNNINIYSPKDDGSYRALFYEPITNRYFWERREKVETAIIKMHNEMAGAFENTYSVYSWLLLLPSELMNGFPDGEADKYMDLGWPTSSMFDNELLEIDIKSGGEVHGGEWDGYPCLTLSYSTWPEPNFRPSY